MRSFKTETEMEVGQSIERIFVECPDSIETKLANFPKYVRRQHLKRFLTLYELFKRVLPVKGSIIECGVFHGFSLMSWAKLSAMLEPENLTRRIYGFDSFEGFPSVHENDRAAKGDAEIGEFSTGNFEELKELIREHDRDRFLSHIPKVELIQGDATKTIPEFVNERKHLLVSLLYLDFDLYEPTLVALRHFVSRMPRGAILAFDELDNPIWPGETQALLDTFSINQLEIQRLEWDPYVGFVVIS